MYRKILLDGLGVGVIMSGVIKIIENEKEKEKENKNDGHSNRR